jgi:negative regulator of genetic competence, sporulation and motility
MDFNLISKTKLKIVLNKKECSEYGITSTDGEYEGAAVRTSLGHILAKAEADVGFRIGSEQVLIQLYPTLDDGCEIFVTRLSNLTDKEKKSLISKDSLSTYSGRECVYRFDSLDNLTSAARALQGREGKWDVYLADTGEYYVSFKEHSVDGFSDFDILSEYAVRKKALPPEVMVERGRMLCKGNGIEIFSKL